MKTNNDMKRIDNVKQFFLWSTYVLGMATIIVTLAACGLIND